MFKHPIHQQLFDFWQAARVPGGIPPRASWSLAKLAAIAGDVVIFRVERTGEARFVFNGPNSHDRLGEEVVGISLNELLPDGLMDNFKNSADACVRQPGGMLVKFGIGGPGEVARSTSLMLPVQGDLPNYSYFLNVTASEEGSPMSAAEFKALTWLSYEPVDTGEGLAFAAGMTLRRN